MEIYQRIPEKIRKGEAMDIELQNFKEEELSCPCCRQVKDSGFWVKLQTLRYLTGPLKINSAFRCGNHNKKVGGAKKSFHQEARAVDINIKKMTSVEKANLLKNSLNLGLTVICYPTHLHIDDRKKQIFYSK